jgi:hypothetical protein
MTKQELENQYLIECTKYFAPLDEMREALDNREGIARLSYKELLVIVDTTPNLKLDLAKAL